MVTMPSEAADDYTLVHNLLKQGMDCMRINCAHDNADIWLKMIQNLKMAMQSLDMPCRIVMDLAGPKLRTGPMEPGPAVIHLRPKHDAYGRIVAPARIWLTVDPSLTPPPQQLMFVFLLQKNGYIVCARTTLFLSVIPEDLNGISK